MVEQSSKGQPISFTVNCAEHRGDLLLTNHITLLRQSFRKIKRDHRFDIDAIVVLPDYLHCIWTLPSGDADYKTRWSLIKAGFSRAIPPRERRSASRVKRDERRIWQRRYWKHLIRDDCDFGRHVEYNHWNPVKHGSVKRGKDWPYSSFQAYVRPGEYPTDRASEPDKEMGGGELHDRCGSYLTASYAGSLILMPRLVFHVR